MASFKLTILAHFVTGIPLYTHRWPYGSREDIGSSDQEFLLVGHSQGCGNICCFLYRLSTHKIWDPKTGRTVVPTTGTLSAMGGLIPGFYHRVIGVPRQYCHLGNCRPLFERNSPGHASNSSYSVYGGRPLHGPCRKTPQHATKLSFRLRSSVSQQILAGTFSLEWYQVTVKLCLSSSIRWSNRSPKSGNWTIPSGLRP